MSKEYIEREAAINALDELCDRVCLYSKKNRAIMCGACPLGHAFDVIEEAIPAADVVEVVRCKDCKHARPGHDEKYGEYWECTYTSLDQHFDEDHFCSYGERKGGDE